MGAQATAVGLAINLLQADAAREQVVQTMQERFGLDRHDAVAVVAEAGAVLRGARARRRMWNVR
jgi:predicted kinase